MPHLIIHTYIICNVDFPCLKAPQLCITKRNIRSIKIESFIESIKEAGFGSDTDTIDRLVEIYNSNLLTVLDTHAPLTCKTLTSRPKSHWYSDDLREVKREVRKFERRYIKNRSSINFDILNTNVLVCIKLSSILRRQHFIVRSLVSVITKSFFS